MSKPSSNWLFLFDRRCLIGYLGPCANSWLGPQTQRRSCRQMAPNAAGAQPTPSCSTPHSVSTPNRDCSLVSGVGGLLSRKPPDVRRAGACKSHPSACRSGSALP